MSWTEITLGDALSIKHGFAFKGAYFADDGAYVILTPGNFHEKGGFRLRPGKDRAYFGDFPETYILEQGDIIVAMTEQGLGLLGSSAIVPDGNRYLHNQRLGLITKLDETVLNKSFLYHLFNTRGVRAQISGSASGTKVRHTSPERICKVRVRIPDLGCQAQIAKTLSAYDDLIENNRQRIALLERAARELYREWFVRLRFPGHEDTKIVDGVPEEWERTALGNIGQLNYGKALKADDRIDGGFPVYGSSGIIGNHHESYVQGPGIIVGRKGNVGSVYWTDEDFWPIDTVYFFEPSAVTLYIYYTLQNVDFISTDAAVPGLNRNFARSRKVLMPSGQVRDAFDGVAAPLHKQISLLQKENASLSQAGDLLLPRLMSGEIAVRQTQ